MHLLRLKEDSEAERVLIVVFCATHARKSSIMLIELLVETFGWTFLRSNKHYLARAFDKKRRTNARVYERWIVSNCSKPVLKNTFYRACSLQT